MLPAMRISSWVMTETHAFICLKNGSMIQSGAKKLAFLERSGTFAQYQKLGLEVDVPSRVIKPAGKP